MSDNVIRLPRPHPARPAVPRLGPYLRVGWNQHRDLVGVLAAGNREFHGTVVDAGSNFEQLKMKLAKKQKSLGLFRQAIGHFAETESIRSLPQLPQTRGQRRESR